MVQQHELELAVKSALRSMGVDNHDMLATDINDVIYVDENDRTAQATAVDVAYDAAVSSAKMSEAVIALMRSPVSTTLDGGIAVASADIERCLGAVCHFSEVYVEPAACPTDAMDHFAGPTFGKMSTLSLMDVVDTASSTSCGAACLATKACQAFQIKPSTGACHLLRASAGQLKRNSRWRFFSRNLFCDQKMTSSSFSSTSTSTAAPTSIGAAAGKAISNDTTAPAQQQTPPQPNESMFVLKSMTSTPSATTDNSSKHSLSSMGIAAFVVTAAFVLIILLLVCCIVRSHRRRDQRPSKTQRLVEKLSLASAQHDNPLYADAASELTWDESAMRAIAYADVGGDPLTLQDHLESREYQAASPLSRLRPTLLSSSVNNYGGVTYNHAEALGVSNAVAQNEPVYSRANRAKKAGPTSAAGVFAPTPPLNAPLFDAAEMEHFIDNVHLYNCASTLPSENGDGGLEDPIYAHASPCGEVDNPIYASTGSSDVVEPEAIYVQASNTYSGTYSRVGF